MGTVVAGPVGVQRRPLVPRPFVHSTVLDDGCAPKGQAQACDITSMLYCQTTWEYSYGSILTESCCFPRTPKRNDILT